MAGSFAHCVFASNNKIFLMDIPSLDNLGDAMEAIEEMFFMIEYLSNGDAHKMKEASDAFYLNFNKDYKPESISKWLCCLEEIENGN